MGESHWASRSCEICLKLWVVWFYLGKGLPAGPHARHVGALLLRHGERGGGEEVVGQHWNYWQSQFHLKRQRGRGELCLQLQLSCVGRRSCSPIQFDRALPGEAEQTCKHTCSCHLIDLVESLIRVAKCSRHSIDCVAKFDPQPPTRPHSRQQLQDDAGRGQRSRRWRTSGSTLRRSRSLAEGTLTPGPTWTQNDSRFCFVRCTACSPH